MKRLIRLLIPTSLLVLMLAPTALAGSVTVVTFAELPSDFDAGTPYTLDYSILAHGTEPMPFSETSLHFRGPNGEDLTFPAESTGNGQWTAEVTLPEAGEWQWEVLAGDQVVQPLGTLPVHPAPAAVPAGLINSLRIALPIATLLALVLLVDQIRTRPRTERQPSAATDAV
ncbi:MAG TPA: hypothetical protein VHM29_10685 [Acidimicrobiia bacterium]|nr:hypothetical protein [Acidimicrobiia bacterium]